MRQATIGLLRRLALVVATIAIAVAAAACNNVVEESPWWFGFRNDSDLTLMLQEQGWDGEGIYVKGMLMPAHSRASAGQPSAEGSTLSMVVFDTDCRAVGSTSLTQETPVARVDEAGGLSAVGTDVADAEGPGGSSLSGADVDLPLGLACGFKGLQVAVRNDWGREVIVLVDYGLYSEQRRVPANSRGGLDSDAFGAHLAGASVELYDTDCHHLGAVEVSRELGMVYVDTGGAPSARRLALFWEEPPLASFRNVAMSLVASPCPSAG